MFKRRIAQSSAICIFVFLLFATVMFPQGQRGQATRPTIPAAVVDYSLEFPGHVVLQGAPQSAGVCSYPYFVMKIQAAFKRSRSLILQSNPSTCQLIVAEKRDLPLNQKPPKPLFSRPETKRIGYLGSENPTVEKLQNALSFFHPSSLTRPPLAGKARFRKVALMRRQSCSNFDLSDTVNMYGYGGQWDVLTQKSGYIAVKCYSDGTVEILDHDGWCWVDGSTYWVNDSCTLDSIHFGPDYDVYRYASGSFHWAPGGYYHALGDGEYATADTYECDSWYSGSIVSGVYPQCNYF